MCCMGRRARPLRTLWMADSLRAKWFRIIPLSRYPAPRAVSVAASTVLYRKEARVLIDTTDVTTPIGLRDRR